MKSFSKIYNFKKVYHDKVGYILNCTVASALQQIKYDQL